MRVLPLVLLILPGTAGAEALNCTFTSICSLQTDCQTHDGVPFNFDVTDGRLSFSAEEGVINGTALPHLTSPAFGALFQSPRDSTVLLTVAGDGSAVMSEQSLHQSGGIQSVSYFGTCEPGA